MACVASGGAHPTLYAAATSHAQTGKRSYIIGVDGVHISQADAIAYIHRRATELCPDGFDLLEGAATTTMVGDDGVHCNLLGRRWLTRDGATCMGKFGSLGVATIQYRWHGL